VAEREARSKKFLGFQTDHAAMHTFWALEGLVDVDDEIIGADLHEAIEKWKVAYDLEKASNAAIERRRLFEGARQRIGHAV
jgi:hypothetical protein